MSTAVVTVREVAPAGQRPSVAERLWSRVVRVPSSGCWEWQGHDNSHGYGRISVDGRRTYVHRLAWELYTGEPIPAGLVVRHLVCDNPPCCNPAHLQPGTHADNSADCRAKGRAVAPPRNDFQRAKTHCPAGHEYAGRNLMVGPKGRRDCRACNARRGDAYRAKGRGGRPARQRGDFHRAKTHCPQDHAYSGDNLRIRADGGRACRACDAAHGAARNAARRRVRQEVLA